MSSSDEEEALLLLAIAEDEAPKKMWVHDINAERRIQTSLVFLL